MTACFAQVVKGIVEGCRQSDCKLLGGEVSLSVLISVCARDQGLMPAISFIIHWHGVLLQTAEMPGFYQPGEYDVAGFAVGAVKQERVIDGKSIVEGDVLLGLPSSGVHSNGFSLVRKVLQVWLRALWDCVRVFKS